MLQLCQLNLQFAFPGPGALSENVQNQGSSIQNLAIKNLFQIPALGRGKFVIKNDGIDVRAPAVGSEFIRFSFANKCAGTGSGQFLLAIADDISPCSGCQFGKFLQ
jgi:hypothetical protein